MNGSTNRRIIVKWLTSREWFLLTSAGDDLSLPVSRLVYSLGGVWDGTNSTMLNHDAREIAGYEVSIGAHRFVFEPPNFLLLKFVGVFTIAQARELVDLGVDAGDRHGPLLVCADVTHYARSGPMVREIFAKGKGRGYNWRAVGVCGASYTMEIAMKMVLRAEMVLKRKVFGCPAEFFPNESAARQWLASIK